jgi:GT2 family glycosyltransferase
MLMSSTRQPPGSFEVPMLALFCAAMRREEYDKIGPLDERFGMGMFEDDDYALRMKQAGYKLLCAEDVFIHHWGSAGFSKAGFANYWRSFQVNLKQFKQKWNQPWHRRYRKNCG